MELYIGGYAQGKLRYVLGQHLGENLTVTDGAACRGLNIPAGERIVLNHFHLLVKNMMQDDKDIYGTVMDFVDKNGNSIIISDEIGNGIVPMHEKDREYRELTGRLLTELAGKAARVERIICGIGVRLK